MSRSFSGLYFTRGNHILKFQIQLIIELPVIKLLYGSGFSFSGRSGGSFPEQRLEIEPTRRPAAVLLLHLVYSCCPTMSGIIKVIVSLFRKGEEVAIDIERHRSLVPADKEKHKGVFELKKIM